MNRNLSAILTANRTQALKLAQSVGIKNVQRLLKASQSKLNSRLRQVEGLSGPGAQSFTAIQLRATLAQVQQVMTELRSGMQTSIVDDGKKVAVDAARHTIDYVQQADKAYTGVAERLPIREAAVFDRSVKGAEGSLLRRLLGDKKKAPGILARYGESTIADFEKRLQLRLLTKTPWDDVRNELIADSPFLQQAPAHWAERIVRTEIMGAHNTAQFEGIREVNREIGGGMLKILVATFDSRTGADSYAVHGQIRRPTEAFEDWTHLYQHPPNRPNDRETVVPHNIAWPIPFELEWKSDSEVSSRWYELGNKKSVPARPTMTTVPLDKIGESA